MQDGVDRYYFARDSERRGRTLWCIGAHGQHGEDTSTQEKDWPEHQDGDEIYYPAAVEVTGREEQGSRAAEPSDEFQHRGCEAVLGHLHPGNCSPTQSDTEGKRQQPKVAQSPVCGWLGVQLKSARIPMVELSRRYFVCTSCHVSLVVSLRWPAPGCRRRRSRVDV